jgi:hypothetical protein
MKKFLNIFLGNIYATKFMKKKMKKKKTPLLPGSSAQTPRSGCSDLPARGRTDPAPVAAAGARRGLPLPAVAGARWGLPRPKSTAGALVECTATSRRRKSGGRGSPDPPRVSLVGDERCRRLNFNRCRAAAEQKKGKRRGARVR